MTRDWFTNIIKTYPKAYYECLFRFKDFYPLNWKDKMRNAEALMEYFKEREVTIEIICNPLANHPETHYGFRITGALEIKSMKPFATRKHVEWAALEFAFSTRNFKLRLEEKLRQRALKQAKIRAALSDGYLMPVNGHRAGTV